jgi:pseudo-rSAM protein
MKHSYWFYLEPFVHTSIKQDNVLFYNTLNGRAIDYKGNPTIIRMIKKLKLRKNLLVVKLTDTDQKCSDISLFVKRIRKYFMGDIIEVSYSAAKPIQMMPQLDIQKDIERFKKELKSSVGENIMNYLREISIHINSHCRQHCSLCKNAHKQFLFCTNKDDDHELEIETIKHLLEEAAGSALSRLNILGGNIFAYSKFKELTVILNQRTIFKTYYIHYLNLHNHLIYIDSLDSDSSRLVVLVPFPIEIHPLKETLRWIGEKNISADVTFVIQSNKEMECAEHTAAQLKMSNFSFKAFYNGRNLGFFKRSVFITRHELLESLVTQKEIFLKMAINPLHFGKLVVLNNGSVYANVNENKIGNIRKASLYDMVYKEMYSGKSWRKLRTTVDPCKDCLYNLLCPPILNYEHTIGRHHLCRIWKEKTRCGNSPQGKNRDR